MKIGRIDWHAPVIVSAFVLQVFFFAPLQVFLANTSDFPVSVSQVFGVFVVVSIVLAGLLYATSRLAPRVVLPVLSFLTVVALLESTVFLTLARHRPFDGKAIDWSRLGGLSAAELAVAAIVGLLVVVFRRRQEVWYRLALAVLVFHLLGLGHTLYARPPASPVQTSDETSAYLNGFYRLSTHRNVIHIVPDQTQGAMVYDIFQSDLERYSRVFDGFTLFTQAMGRYPSTYPSVSFYMTGQSPDPGADYSPAQSFNWRYIRRTLADHSIVKALANNGFRTYGFQVAPLYCVGPFTGCAAGDVFDGLPRASIGWTAAVLQMQDVAFFKTTPIAVRQHIYDDGGWFLKRALRKGRTYSAMLDAFLAEMTTDSPTDTYSYIHLAGGHAPLQFDEACNYIGIQEITYENQRRQVVCAMSQIERLIQSLKRLGVYDQTMIVVNADHGTPGLPASLATGTGKVISASLAGTASALVLIKPMNARGPLTFSTAPASIGDIPATVNDAMTLNGRFAGQSLFQLDGSNREREFHLYDETDRVSRLQMLPNVRRYRVRGSLFDENDWIRPVFSDNGQPPSVLWMDHEKFERYASGFSALEMHSKPVRWVTGTRGQVLLSFPTTGKARLVLESHVPPFIAGQSMAVSVNKRVIARLDDKELTARMRHVLVVPEDVPRKAVNTIELEMGKTARIRPNSRELSIVVVYIGLEPAG